MRTKDILYFGVLFLGVILSVIRFPVLRKAEKVLAFLLLTTLLQEAVSYTYFIKEKSNLDFFRLFSLLEFALVTSYYYLLVPNKNSRLTIIFLIAGGLFWFFFPIAGPTTAIPGLSFLLFEAVSILCISLLSCLRLALREDANPLKSAGFWITISFIIYWSIAYTRFGLLTFPYAASTNVRYFLEDAFFITNIAFYTALAAILAFYKRFSVSI